MADYPRTTRRKLSELTPADYNPRTISDRALAGLKASLDRWGLVQPVVLNVRTGNVVGGHQRMKALAAGANGDDPEVDVVEVDLPPLEERALNVALNNPAIQGEWSGDLDQLLDQVRDELDPEAWADLLLSDLVQDDDPPLPTRGHVPLVDQFVVPPFSVLDARKGYWTTRKREWRAWGVRPEEGRDNLGTTPVTCNASEGVVDYMSNRGPKAGGSTFDPVLAEVVMRWFCPTGGHVLDPFGGESTKGLVAGALGLDYTGVELRPEQVEANESQAADLGVDPSWVVGDSAQLDQLLPEGQLYDLAFTSPPYYDLEIYQGGDQDGSGLATYGDFMDWLLGILRAAARRLRDQRFLVLKLGDVRDKPGAYRGLVADTVVGLRGDLALYNHAILVTPGGSLPVRAGPAFRSSRKLGKTHQDVLVFWKGDPRQVGEVFPREVPVGEAGAADEEAP